MGWSRKYDKMYEQFTKGDGWCTEIRLVGCEGVKV